MDPISVIGLAGSVLGIVDVITKNISFLRDLQSKYRQADLTVSLIISHLSTVKAAMNQISVWINSDLNAPKHQQLIEDLSLALEGCLLLVALLETRLDELFKDDSQKLSTMGKIGMLWEESQMKDYLNHLSHQINALNLLLQAIQCRSIFEQSNILSSNESRRIMSLVKEDTSSLLVIGDADSFRTERSASTSNSRLVDAIFDFDREVFTSKVYRSALRSNMIQNLRKGLRLRPKSYQEGPASHPPRSLASQSIAEHDYEDKDESIEDMENTALLLPIQQVSSYVSPIVEDDEEEEENDASNYSNTVNPPRPKDQISLNSQSSGDFSKNSEKEPLVVDKDNDLKSTIKISVTRKRVVENIRKFRSIPALSNRKSMSLVSNTATAWVQRTDLERKIVIIGATNSGKSTLAKSMDILGSNGKHIGLHSSFILSQWWETILLNLYFNVNVIMDAMEGFGQMGLTSLDLLERSTLRIGPWTRLDGHPERLRAIEKLWKDETVQSEYWHLCNSNLLLENAAYLFDSVRRIGSNGYLPSARDILWASERTVGTSKTSFEIERNTYEVYEMGGSRFERRKWMQAQYRMHQVGNSSTTVLTADVTGYHKTMAEDGHLETDYMSESLKLFESLCNSTWFSRSGIILLFTKLDQLESALLNAPLKNTFPDYEGSSDGEAARFITEKFLALVPKERRPICVGFTSIAGDPGSMASVVSNGINHYKKNGHYTCDYFLLSPDGVSKSPAFLLSQISESDEKKSEDNESYKPGYFLS